ncbi:ATP-binding protein [Nonomuraea sp. NPDC047897]|uniref:ATP-binding protein n=1 Tax=Nonomuraea sp. NPDC047897 TaxID=3364346 RepID=UPI00371A92A8
MSATGKRPLSAVDHGREQGREDGHEQGREHGREPSREQGRDCEHVREPSSFVGRRHELATARKMLSQARLLTLTGTGGVGKTRLALRLAESVGGYKDGVEVVELATLESGDLLGPAVAAALGLCDERRDSATLLMEYLSDKRMLLVLDNCEHLLDDCAQLVDRLLRRAPYLRVLATSRQTLGVYGEQVLAVPSLSVPDPAHPPRDIARHDSVRLFVDRAAMARPGFTLDAGNAACVARLAQRLEGIPLAIELAAARLRTLPPERLLSDLDACLDVSADGGGTVTLPRHRTLRETMDWSFRLCSPGEQRLWARLSMFPGGAELETAEEVCAGDGIDAGEVFDLLSGLVDKSIMAGERRPGGFRYRMLESIRAYGAERLEPAEERALRRRCVGHYRELTERNRVDLVVPDQVERYRILQRELPNVRAALDLSLDDPELTPNGLETATALWGYWLIAGTFTEGRYWIGRCLDRVPDPTGARATALWVDAMLALRQGDPAAAAPRMEECQVIARLPGNEEVMPYAIRTSGILAYATGEPERGMALLEEALVRHRAIGDVSGVVFALYYLAAYGSVLDPDRSAALGEELLELCETHHAVVCRGYAQLSLGLAAWNQGDPVRAEALVSAAAEFTEEVNDRWCLTQCLEVLAWTAGARDDHRRAALLLGAAHAMWQAVEASPQRLWYHAVWHGRCEDQARRALGERAFRSAFLEGARQRAANRLLQAVSA